MSSEKPEQQPQKHATLSQETNSASSHTEYEAWFADILEAEGGDLKRFRKIIKVLSAVETYATFPREFPDRALMHARRKLNEARSAFQETCLRQGTRRALNAVIDAAITLGARAALSPVTKEYFFAEIQSERGTKSGEARAKKGRWWVPRASRLITERWRTRKSEPSIAADVSLKLSDEQGRTVSEKTLLRHIQSMKKAGELEPRRNTTANRSKQPASRPDSA